MEKFHGSPKLPKYDAKQCTEVRFTNLLSGEFTTMAVINPLERKLAKRTSVQWAKAWVKTQNDKRSIKFEETTCKTPGEIRVY